MGQDKIRHLREKTLTDKSIAFFWQPSKSVKKLGLVAEALGTDRALAEARARHLNKDADERRANPGRSAGNGPAPGTIALLFAQYLKSVEVMGEAGNPALPGLKPRTQKDLRYYLDKVEREFGEVRVSAMTPKVIKTYYQRVARERGITWAYHIVWALRCALSWAVSENWIAGNPALQVEIKGPPKRTVQWSPDEAEAFLWHAIAGGWLSIAAGADLMDCTAQSPVDVWKLKAADYDGAAIVDEARAKTREDGARRLLWPNVKARLDAYLATRPPLHPGAPLLANDKTGTAWVESTRHKVFARIRKAAGLRPELQLQDFRRTAMTEARKAGATSIEVKNLVRHASERTQERYIQPDATFVDAAQAKRLKYRTQNK